MAQPENLSKVAALTAIVLSVFRTNGRMIEWGNQFAAPQGLTSARWQMLGAIALAPQPPTVPQIGAAMGVTRQGVLRQVNLLVEEGLLMAQPNPTHRRSPVYVLTPAGSAAYGALMQRWQQHATAVGDGFSEDDLAAAARVLAALTQAHQADQADQGG